MEFSTISLSGCSRHPDRHRGDNGIERYSYRHRIKGIRVTIKGYLSCIVCLADPPAQPSRQTVPSIIDTQRQSCSLVVLSIVSAGKCVCCLQIGGWVQRVVWRCPIRCKRPLGREPPPDKNPRNSPAACPGTRGARQIKPSPGVNTALKL